MKLMISVFCCLAVSLALVSGSARSDEKKTEEVTLKGKVTCAKCDLKESESCHTVLVVDKVTYWFDAASTKKYHKEICGGGKNGTVVGTVSEKDGKKVIAVTKLDYDK